MKREEWHYPSSAKIWAENDEISEIWLIFNFSNKKALCKNFEMLSLPMDRIRLNN